MKTENMFISRGSSHLVCHQTSSLSFNVGL